MSTPTTIKIGESKLFRIPLFQADGTTALLASSLASCRVQLVQAGTTRALIAMAAGSALRADGDAVVLEITSEVSASLKVGALTLRFTLVVADASFVASGGKFTAVVDMAEISVT